MKNWRALRRAPARDITFAVVIKLGLLAALFALFARPSFHPASDAATTAAAVAGDGQMLRAGHD